MLAIGLMSGTSLDGVDACLVDINPVNEAFKIKGFICYPYPDVFKKKLLDIVSNKPTNIETICSLNVELSLYYIEACETLLNNYNIDKKDIRFIAMHGQTVWHHPRKDNEFEASTLQLGDPSRLAYKLNTIVVSNFRAMDISAGGEGAPLVPFANYVLFNSKKENLVLQNIGGIGNATFLKKGGTVKDIIAYDTGPGNILIDQACRILFHKEFDYNGEIACNGRVNHQLLEILFKDPYLSEKLPKSTGREKYNNDFVEQVIYLAKELNMNNNDIIATLSAYTADTITESYKRYLGKIDRVILSGGGALNKYIVERIKNNLDKVEVEINQDSDALEALSFAVMGYYTLNHQPSNVPNVTGAKVQVVLGEVTNPHIK